MTSRMCRVKFTDACVGGSRITRKVIRAIEESTLEFCSGGQTLERMPGVRSCRSREVMRKLFHERGSETIRKFERSKRDDVSFGKQLGGQVYHKESNRKCASSMRICTRRWYEVVAMSTLTGVRSAELYVRRAPQIDIVARIDQQNSREPKS